MKIQPGHYQNKVLTQVDEMLCNLPEASITMDQEIGERNTNRVAVFLGGIRTDLMISIPFWIEHLDLILKTDYRGMQFPDTVRLPYPRMCIEYYYPDWAYQPQIFEESRTNPIKCLAHQRLLIMRENPDFTGFTLVCWWYNEKHKLWVPSDVFLELKYSELTQLLDDIATRRPSMLRTHSLLEDFYSLTEVPYSTVLGEFSDEIRTIVRFLALLNCNNVVPHTLPASPSLNRKRKKKGQYPLPDYKILSVKRPKTLSKLSGGTHASPTTHFRRGHVRKLPSGAFTWVRPTVVNPTGDEQIPDVYMV